MEKCIGRMVASIRDSGKWINTMVKEYYSMKAMG
jgi:hypothetical protein